MMPGAPGALTSIPQASGTVDGYLSKSDYQRFDNMVNAGPVVSLSGDVSTTGTGNLTVSVDKIKNIPVMGSPTVKGQILRYEAGQYSPQFIGMQDLRSNVTGSAALPGTCGPNKTLTFNSALDNLQCEAISITRAQISDLSSLSVTRSQISDLSSLTITKSQVSDLTLGPLATASFVDLASQTSGVLPIASGGTGATTAPTARSALGLKTGAITDTGKNANEIPVLGSGLSANKYCVASAGGDKINCTANAPDSSQWTTSGGSIYYNGSVTIGNNTSPVAKLEVDGAVKFGETGSVCNAATEGQQRYNSTSKKMEFCDGTSWAAYSTGGGGGGGGLSGCPSGYTLVADSATYGIGAFCINKNRVQGKAINLDVAMQKCAADMAQVCTASQLAAGNAAEVWGPSTSHENAWTGDTYPVSKVFINGTGWVIDGFQGCVKTNNGGFTCGTAVDQNQSAYCCKK